MKSEEKKPEEPSKVFTDIGNKYAEYADFEEDLIDEKGFKKLDGVIDGHDEEFLGTMVDQTVVYHCFKVFILIINTVKNITDNQVIT